GSDHELAGKHVLIDDTGVHHFEQSLSVERLEAMRIRSLEPGAQPQQPVDDTRSKAAEGWPAVEGALEALGADDHVIAFFAKTVERPLIEADIAEVDLIADHETPARFANPFPQRQPIVGLIGLEQPQLRVSFHKPVGDIDGAVA